MRGAALASILVLFALAGCMQQSSEDDWDAYDSGRGMAFGMLLTLLLIIGVVVLVVNLTAQNRVPAPAPPERLAPDAEAAPPAAGWEPVSAGQPAARAPAPRKAAKRTSKPAKPRRRSP